MKRLLSLLVVIAMVVSMIPSVFAAKEEVDMDELLGRLVVLEDIEGFSISLAEGSDGMIYQWTPAADEIAESVRLSWQTEANLNVVVTTGETVVTATSTPVEEGEGFLGELELAIVAGQMVEIEISEAEGKAVEAYISGILELPFGIESNPIFVEGNGFVSTIEKASWYTVRHNGPVVVTGEGDFNVIYEGVTYAAVDGKAEFEAVQADFFAPIPKFQIDAAGTYTFSLVVPVGTMDNPAELVLGTNTASLKAGSQGYYYTWTATEEGTLKITMPAGNWAYKVDNLTTYKYGDMQWSDSDPVVNPTEIAVAAGDEIQVVVNTYDPANMWEAPAGEIVFTAELVLPTPEEPEKPALTITAQPQDTLVVLGTPGSMTVEVEGEVKSYKWEISTDGGNTWKNTSISGYNTNTLNVPGTTVRHKAMFRCVITPVEGEAITSEAATHYVAFLEVTPADQKVKTNENATFTAKWSVDGATYSWQYKKNGTEGAEWIDCTSSIASGRLSDTITSQAKANRNLFGFRCVITYNGETYYSCEDSDKGARILICEEAAEITAQPENQTVRSGDRAVFTVEAAGTGVTYQWQVKKPTSGWFNTSMTGATTNTLTVRAYDVRNGYQYKCRIRTPNGAFTIDVYTEPVTLTVLPAADIITQPTNTTVAVGESAVFSVQAEGEGLTYQWQVSTNGGTTFRNLNSGEGLQTPELTVQATAHRNGYYYRCMIMNKFYDGVGYGSMYTDKVKLTVE